MAVDADAALPRAVARAFLDAGIPLSAVSVYVREAGGARPLMSHRPGKPLNPASTRLPTISSPARFSEEAGDHVGA